MRLTAKINCGDGAFMTIVDPRSFEDGGVGWKLRYGTRMAYATLPRA